jgi:hypothetical protein
MSATTLFWLVVMFIAVFSLLVTVLIVKQVTGAVKRAGGVQKIKQQMQARKAGQHLAQTAPLATPAGQAGTTLGSAVFIGALGLILLVGGWLAQQHHIREVRLLQNEGVVGDAVVTAQRISESDDSATYYVTFTFTAIANDERVEVQREVSVPSYFYHRVEYGSKIEVRYARSDPKIVKINAFYTPGRIQYWWLIGASGTGVLCLGITWSLLGAYRQARRLDKEGITTAAVVLDRFEYSDTESITYYVAYALPGAGPIRHPVEKGVYDRLSVGQTFNLAYLSDKPKVFRPLWK